MRQQLSPLQPNKKNRMLQTVILRPHRAEPELDAAQKDLEA